MAEGDIGSVQGSVEFDTDVCQYSKILHVDGLIYAIAYTSSWPKGTIKTVSISADGATVALTGQSLNFDEVACYESDFIKIADNVFAVVYKYSANELIVRTISITDAGVISLSGMASLELDSAILARPNIIHVTGNIYAVVYQESDSDGWIKTVTISADGSSITATGHSLEFESGQAAEIDIIHCTCDVFAVGYRDENTHGKIATVEITDTGAMSLTGMTTLIFDSTYGDDVRTIHVTGNIYAIVYSGPDTDGWIRTVTISADGSSITATGHSLEFDINDCYMPRIIHISGELYAIVYMGADSDGWLKTVNISDTGVITGADITGLEFDNQQGQRPHIKHVTGNIYAIVYEDQDGDGDLVTVDIETVLAGMVRHELIMGIG